MGKTLSSPEEQDEVDGMKQEVDSKGNVMHIEMSDCVIERGRERERW